MAVPEKILELVERFELVIDKYKSSYKEEEIKIEFINPFFEALGWDVRNKSNKPPDQREVRFEYTLRSEGETQRPDYSFWLDRERKFFLDAKKPSVNIEGGITPAFQIKRYAWSANLPLAIVTDFEEFAVYDCRTEPFKLDKPKKSRLLLIKYYEYEKRWDEIASLFSKEAVQRGSLGSIPSPKGKKVDDALLEDISDWRNALAASITKMNPEISQKSLNYAVQMTIDRILFLRICEDRSIEDSERLKGLLDGDDVYERLFELFEEADKRYNSGLFHFHPEEERNNFDAITPSIKIEDNVLKNIIQSLYYPDSPYVFSEIPADILGHVYEQFLGKVIQLDESHKVSVVEKPEVRKAGGVYYTPSYIVDYIVKNTVGKLLEGKTPKEASDLRILDPACGSGSFLIVAYQHLLDWHLDWYKARLVPLLDAGEKPTSNGVQNLLPSPIEKPGKNARYRSKKIWERASVATLPIEERAGEWHLKTAERKRILLNNIYGVDIDTQAVEVTKLSLLLKVLEGENKATITDLNMYSDERALPDLGNNIKCGNSLIGWDILESNPGMIVEEIERINPFDWEQEFPEIMSRGGFDAVIGNPPYVRMEVFKEVKGYLKSRYEVHNERSDLYAYFIEGGHKILNKTGKFGMIISNKFLRANYGKPLREFLRQNTSIEQIVDFAGLPVFKNATVRTIILITSMTINNKSLLRYYPPLKLDEFYMLDGGSLSVDQAISKYRYEFLYDVLSHSVWGFTKQDAAELLGRLKSKNVSLDKYCNKMIMRGIVSGLTKAFVIDDDTRTKILRDNPEAKEIIKPFLNGRDVRNYKIDFKNIYLIYTYHGIDIEKYPAVEKHLDKFKDDLKKRATQQEWYELQQPQYNFAKYMEGNKIIFPDIATYPRFALDETGYYSSNTTYFIPYHDLYLLCLLNSRLGYFYFIQSCAGLEGKNDNYLRFFGQYLKPFPIRTIDFSDPQDVARHDKMVSLVETMLDLHKQLQEVGTPHEKTRIQNQIDYTDKQIDALVYELYNLTEDEIAIVEESTK